MSKRSSSEFGLAVSGLIGVVILIAVVYLLTAGRFAAQSASPGTPDEIAARLAPVGKVALSGAEAPVSAGAPAPASGTSDQGADAGASVDGGAAIYQQACVACHATGVAGAPKLGDKAAWEARIAQGLDQLLHTAISGKGAMPPRGTCAACTDEELKSAIEYMISQVQ